LSPSEVADYAQQIGLSGPGSAQRLHPVKAFLNYWKDQGWIENGLASHLRVPRTRRNAPAKPSGSRLSGGGESHQGNKETRLSQEGYDRLVAQLEDLKVERVAVVEEIKLAMADKDFRETPRWTRRRTGRASSRPVFGSWKTASPLPKSCPKGGTSEWPGPLSAPGSPLRT
jgi:hypothetical protein